MMPKDKTEIAKLLILAQTAFENEEYDKAREYYQQAADQGDLAAQMRVARMYERGEGGEQDLEQACKYYQLAAEWEDSAEYWVATYSSYVRIRAEKGDAQAQVAYGHMFSNTGNNKYARIYYQLAANQGNARAQYALAGMHKKGEGGTEDKELARKYYQLAADQGDEDAQCILAIMFYNGEGGPKNLEQARKYFTLAAGQGSSWSKYSLANMMRKSEGGPQDLQAACAYYLEIASGDQRAHYRLGFLIRTGKVSLSDEQAMQYKWLLAKEKDVDIQERLAHEAYYSDDGVQDLVYARKYFILVANSRGYDGLAQLRVARMFECGEGGDQDMKKARYYFRLAAIQGNEEAQEWFRNNPS